MGSGSYSNNTGTGALPLALDLEASATVMSGSTSGRLGTTDNNIFGNASGSMWSTNANLSAGVFTGEGQKTGLLADGNIGAYGLKGEISGGATLFGVSMQGTLGGTLGSAHIGATGGFYYDGKSGTINITLQQNVGLGAGEKAAVNLKIPVPFIKK
ncbi:MAG: hypothetical protein DI529_13770 [Chryseobacterium sp.]|nr:MAG: hypothetical protein DI529_13770 [Chryseobacterium sp.]